MYVSSFNTFFFLNYLESLLSLLILSLQINEYLKNTTWNNSFTSLTNLIMDIENDPLLLFYSVLEVKERQYNTNMYPPITAIFLLSKHGAQLELKLSLVIRNK